MHDIFISYSHKDRDHVVQLADTLENRGYSVWWDKELIPSQDYAEKIEHALNDSRCILTVWSPNSVASKWVRAESSRGFTHDKLVPAMIADAKIPIPFDSVHSADLRNWDGANEDAGLADLLKALDWRLNNPDMQTETVTPVAPKQSLFSAQKNTQRKPRFGWALGCVALAIAGSVYLFMPPTVASPEIKDCQRGNSANSKESIIQAAGRGNVNRVKECLALNMDITTAQDGNGWTALHAATKADNTGIARELYKYDTDILETKNKRGETALHVGAFHNSYQVVHYLIKIGANNKASDNKGDTPFALARTAQMRNALTKRDK